MLNREIKASIQASILYKHLLEMCVSVSVGAHVIGDDFQLENGDYFRTTSEHYDT